MRDPFPELGILPAPRLETIPTPALPEETRAGTAVPAQELFRTSQRSWPLP